MRTDGLFNTKHLRISAKVGESIWLRPFSDVHRDNELHAADAWRDWLKYCAEDGKRAYYLGVGDYMDFVRAHTRAALDILDVEAKDVRHRLQELAREWVTMFAAELCPFKKNIIGLLGGNHFTEFVEKNSRGKESKQHSDAYLADLLGCDYLGTMAAVTLTLADQKQGQADIRIIAHHGAGGATTVGGSLNRVQRMLNGWNANIALMGDDHKRGCYPVGDRLSHEIICGRETLTSNTRWVGRTGSFLRGFEPGKSSYVVDSAYEPTSIGTIEFELKLKKNSNGSLMVSIGGYQPA